MHTLALAPIESTSYMSNGDVMFWILVPTEIYVDFGKTFSFELFDIALVKYDIRLSWCIVWIHVVV